MWDPEKIVIHLSDAELATLGFLGPNAHPLVINFIEAIQKVPQQFEWLTLFQLQCFDARWRYQPTSPTFSEATLINKLLETTAAEPDLVSPAERVHFYTGVSEDPPFLLHRSDILQRPFIGPPSYERFSSTLYKTAHSALHPILKNKLWKDTVAPEVIALLKDPRLGIHVSSMLPVRFSTLDEDDKAIFDDHIVLWISVHPKTTTETSCRDANGAILAILAKHGVEDAAVHWIEGAVESLAGPPMMHVARVTDVTHYVRRALTAVLGVPLALAKSDVQGALGLYFHEGKDRHGNKSKRLMCLTNKHVISSTTSLDYEHKGRQRFIRNCSSQQFQQIVNETRAFISSRLDEAQLFSQQLARINAEPKSEDKDEALADEEHKERKQQEMRRAERDIVELTEFFQLLNSTWSDTYQRIIGYVDWAPKIAKDLDNDRYTRDIGVIALDETKFNKSFYGNSVYLAGKYTRREITSLLSPSVANPSGFIYPKDHLFRLSGCVNAAGLASPYLLDDNDRAGFIVAKAGPSTDLTFGRLSEMEAYTCDKFGRDSWEVAILNYSQKFDCFASKGDSGAAIFNAEGKLVAILHSGMPKGMSNHVTFGTPGHYVVELVKKRYPHADFDCLEFDA